jgi:hypothetical protein
MIDALTLPQVKQRTGIIIPSSCALPRRALALNLRPFPAPCCLFPPLSSFKLTLSPPRTSNTASTEKHEFHSTAVVDPAGEALWRCGASERVSWTPERTLSESG